MAREQQGRLDQIEEYSVGRLRRLKIPSATEFHHAYTLNLESYNLTELDWKVNKVSTK